MFSMEQSRGFFDRITLAMAGGRSPWGRPSGKPERGDNDGQFGGGRGPEGTPEGDGDGRGQPQGGGDNDAPPPRGPRNPWLPGSGEGGDKPRRSATIEDLFKARGPEGPKRTGGGPGFKFPQRPGGKSWLPVGLAAIGALWLVVSSSHPVGSREQGVVTWLGGQYSHTLNPGFNLTMPWPIMMVDIENVSQIRSEQIPEGTAERLILTGDQNLVDLSYRIRWNISDLALFRYQLADPEETLREVAEATMRAAVAEQDLDTVIGDGRADIEQSVRADMQAILDAYRSGITVQGVEIAKTDPPAVVEDAFRDVSRAQQDADAAMNRARTYAQQLLARAQGDAAQFNSIYAEYRLAPEVTRQRLYYETMESVLANTDKTIVEGGNGVTPFLPLPEVRRRAAPADDGPTVTVTPQAGER